MPEVEQEKAEEAEELADLEALKANGDVEGLLELAKSARSKRELKQCFEAYRAAADLGNGDAAYGVALFYLTGGVVPQDLKEGTTQLRVAAEKGSVPAKVYLGNLYELGIHYKADAEKADVWYRNAARGARVDGEPGTPEHTLALAELGCARYALTAPGSDEERARLLQRAKAHGYGLRIRDEAAGDRPTFLDALTAAEAPPEAKTAGAEAETKPAIEKEVTAPKLEKPSASGAAFAAFGYALLFAVAGLGAAYAAGLGAHELLNHGTKLPGLGARAELVFPIVFGVVGVLPTWLVYRLGTVVKALAIACALGGIGFVAWNTGQATLHADRVVQAFAFGLAGFLAALFVLGILGGTKRKPMVSGNGRRRHLSG